MFSKNYSDIFSKNINHTGLIYVLYITLLKLTILSLFPLGVMHHEPCFMLSHQKADSSEGGFAKLAPFFLFSFFYFFFYFIFIAPYGLPGLVWALLWFGVFKLGSISGGKTCQSVLVIRGR